MHLDWTHRYARYLRPDLGLNLVLVLAGGNSLHRDTLYHLVNGAAGQGRHHRRISPRVGLRHACRHAPRTTSKGPPLHEMWLSDPDGTLIEVYTRLTGDELARVDYDQVESLEFTPGLISDSC